MKHPDDPERTAEELRAKLKQVVADIRRSVEGAPDYVPTSARSPRRTIPLPDVKGERRG